MSEIVQTRWDKRLTNWALWMVGGGDTGRSTSPYPAYRDHVQTRGRFESGTPMPRPLVGEALDTDVLVVRLAQINFDQYQAIRAWYVWTGSIADRARTLGIHPDTLTDRVTAARYKLEDLELWRKCNAIKPTPSMLAFGT